MRRLTVVVGAVVVGGVSLFIVPPEASACSCAAPAPGEPHPAVVVEGRAGEQIEHGGAGFETPEGLAGPSSWTDVWRFAVDAIERGPVGSGEEIEVHMTRGDEAGCGVAVQPLEPGRRYRVGGSFDESSRRLHLNLCSGALVHPLGEVSPPDGHAEPVPTTLTAAVTTSTVDKVSTTTVPAISAATTTTVGTTGTTLVATLDGEAASRGLDARVVGAGVAATAGAGMGLLALRRRFGLGAGRSTR